MPFPLVKKIPNVLTIAGSDSGGGAGIQADIKAISATGSYACSIITALTAQNTCGVQAVQTLPVAFIEQQFEAVFSDIRIDAVKIGMLGDADIIRTVATMLERYQPANVVLDPVMVATSGDPLLAESAAQTLISELLPLADLVTPNLPEAHALLGLPVDTVADEAAVLALGSGLMGQGCRSVLVKGGHQTGEYSTDIWIGPLRHERYTCARVETTNTHGTGCTLSASIASFLARGYPMAEAIEQAKHYITEAIRHADQLDVGAGHGPVHHFYALHSH